MKNNLYKLSIVLFGIGCLSLLLLIPFVSNLFITFFEFIKGSRLEDANKYLLLLKKLSLLLSFSCFILGILSNIFKFPKKSSDAQPLFNNSSFILLKNNKLLLALILITYLLCFFVRVFYINQKKSLHVDEVLSVAICNRNNYGYWGSFLPENENYSVEEINNQTLFDDDSIKDLLKDLTYLHIDVKDSPHTNFYYSLLRLWFFNIKSSDIKYIGQHGCYLNLLFFTLSFFILTLFLFSFIKEKYYQIPLLLLISFFNPWTISTSLFLRPYETQQCSIILVSFLFINYLTIIDKGKNVLSLKNFIITSLILSFALITEYFNIFLVFLFGLVLIIRLIRKKQFDNLKFLIYAFVTSLILCKIMYFWWGNGLFEDRGTEAISKLSITNLLNNIMISFVNFFPILSKKSIFLIISIIIFISIYLYELIINKFSNKNLLITLSILWILIVFYFAPYKTQRYVVPIIPIFSIIFMLKEKKFKIIAASLLVLLNSFSLVQQKINPSYDVVEHLDDSNISELNMVNDIKDLKLLIVSQGTWKLGVVLPYLNPSINCTYFTKLPENLTISNNCYFLIEDETSFDINLEQYSKIQQLTYFSLYQKD